jgi:hypothetical protein
MLHTSRQLTRWQGGHNNLGLPWNLLLSEVDLQPIVMFDPLFDVDDLTLAKSLKMIAALGHATHLFNEPVDLPLCPFLLVPWIYHDIFTLMLHGVIHLTTNNSIAGTAASMGVHYNILANLLTAIQN